MMSLRLPDAHTDSSYEHYQRVVGLEPRCFCPRVRGQARTRRPVGPIRARSSEYVISDSLRCRLLTFYIVLRIGSSVPRCLPLVTLSFWPTVVAKIISAGYAVKDKVVASLSARKGLGYFLDIAGVNVNVC
jgi:hypothetical protein